MRFVLFILTACLLIGEAPANPVRQPHIEAELIPGSTAVEPGKTLTVALRLQADPGWHTYWRNPGDTGLPTKIQWNLPTGFEPGPILWPAPQRIDVGPLANYGYEGEVLLLTDIRVPSPLTTGNVEIAAKAEWLVCEEICIPGSAELGLSLPVGSVSPDSAWSKKLRTTRESLPRVIDSLAPTATLAGNEWVLEISKNAAPGLRSLAFFPDAEGWINHAAEQRLTDLGQRWQLRIEAAKDASTRTPPLAGVLVAEPGFAAGASAANVATQFTTGPALPPPAPAGRSLSLPIAVLFALAGGVILNLMPCVFPVVGIKVLTFVEQSRSNPSSLRAHGLLFALGVLVCFWVVAGVLLGLRAGGAALGWGYQLQSPLVVSALAMLFFALALNLSGVYEIGARLQQLAGSVVAESGYLDAFLSGLLATIVATPCTAPLMGAALGFALTQPAQESMLVFTALAAGMAAPYVVLSFSPRLVQRLPKPGPWMETLKQVLAFPLYLTVVWLVWVLGRQTGVDGAARLLVGITLLGTALWTYGRWHRAASARARIFAGVLAAAMLATAVATAWPKTVDPDAATMQSETDWRAWSRAAVEQAQAQGHAVFVDFTAAWCVTCQVNKRLVLERSAVLESFARNRVVLMRADWTNQDPEITAVLRELGRSGVPVYAMYPADGGKPRLLPELLTVSRVLEAITATQATATN